MEVKVKEIRQYRKRILDANKELTKKEIFKDLLNRLYSGSEEILKIIDKISLGSEKTVLNIPRKNNLHRGSADTLYNNIIIEFENDLKITEKHAKEQLAGYFLGQFRSGKGKNYLLIASDFITWKIYAPDVSCLDNLDKIKEHELILNEVKDTSFILTNSNAEEFYYWIDRFLFKSEPQKATLQSIEQAFGYQSAIFTECYTELSKWYNEANGISEVQVAFEQWDKFLSIAYGSFDASERNFLIHTYLSVFSKLLAYTVLSNDDYIDDTELKQILDGSIFDRYNIRNFVENDFFYWVKSEESFHNLKKAFRSLAQEISTFDFSMVEEDILKGVYQELIDLDTRHSLGEYYTPDWLCERVLQEFKFKEGEKILDPSCGSGSFIRAIIHKIKADNENIDVNTLSQMVYGIDIHPLSVQIAKTTLILTLGKAVRGVKKPIRLNIILANTLLAPKGTQDLFGTQFSISIDKKKHKVSTSILENMTVFDTAIFICDKVADQTMNKQKLDIGSFNVILKNNNIAGITPDLLESFYKIYEAFKKVKEEGRDSIWKFILQNLYKPYFLANKIDYIIGNPPWITYSDVTNEDYQDTLEKLATKYSIKPQKVADMPHLEIAAIFLTYCTNYFLKENGKLAFVLPRSFFMASQHDNTRSGKAKGLKIVDIWDLKNVSPLFRIPSCVIFANKELNVSQEKKRIPKDGLDGISFAGRLPSHNCNYEMAKSRLTESPTIWFYSKQGNSTAFTTTKVGMKRRINPYKAEFKQGATIVPRSFYFVDLTQPTPSDFVDRVLTIKTAESIKPQAKTPWNEVDIYGKMEGSFFYYTALSNNILPFTLYNPYLVALPITVDEDAINNTKFIRIRKASSLLRSGFLEASSWFKKAESIWETKRTEKSKKMSAQDRVDFQKGLTSQNLNAPYLVLYNSSAKDANATVVVRDDYSLDFIVESKTYVFYTILEEEAYYLAAILNSSIPNQMMKEFQTQGLFGPRDVHKKILDVFFPKYSEELRNHRLLAELSKDCHLKVKLYLAENPQEDNLSPHQLGKLRVSINKYIESELKEIDSLVEKIMK